MKVVVKAFELKLMFEPHFQAPFFWKQQVNENKESKKIKIKRRLQQRNFILDCAMNYLTYNHTCCVALCLL